MGDVVGAEKFLQVQGFTYYGCLYAQGAEDLTMKATGSVSRRGRATNASLQSSPDRGDVTKPQPSQSGSIQGSALPSARSANVTCAYIDQKLLHMIPFYDWYEFKESLEKRYKEKCSYIKG